jgi:L-asparagine transporter-like permease
MALFGFCFSLSKHPRLLTRIRHAVLSAVVFSIAVTVGVVAAAALLEWDNIRNTRPFVAWLIRNGLPFFASVLAMVVADRLLPDGARRWLAREDR